jgi:hypothetical protein
MMSLVSTLLQGNMMRFQVGQQMFCPACHSILDWQDAVAIDFENPDKSCIFTKCYCGTCFDLRIATNVNQARVDIEAKVQRPVSVKITDGRQYLDDHGTLVNAVMQEELVPCKTRFKKDGWVDVLGFRVDFNDMPWAGHCFVYQSDVDKMWSVVESRTGSAISRSGSRQSAIWAAARRLAKVGEEKFLATVAKMSIKNTRADKRLAKAALAR